YFYKCLDRGNVEGPLVLGLEPARQTVDGYSVSLQSRKTRRSESFYAISIDPPLEPGKSVAFQFTRNSSNGVMAYTKEELLSRKDVNERMVVNISYPSDSLDMQFTFPPGYIPIHYGHDVWYGDGMVRHEDEYARITRVKGFNRTKDGEDNCCCLSLRLKYPLLGLKYVIWWVPPDAATLLPV
ncbi:MAG: hypothetical protein KKA81_17045, partial [Bacteroidetes bacterium]|nr:hypothetical protein [Bacteroidota bacterium]